MFYKLQLLKLNNENKCTHLWPNLIISVWESCLVFIILFIIILTIAMNVPPPCTRDIHPERCVIILYYVYICTGGMWSNKLCFTILNVVNCDRGGA